MLVSIWERWFEHRPRTAHPNDWWLWPDRSALPGSRSERVRADSATGGEIQVVLPTSDFCPSQWSLEQQNESPMAEVCLCDSPQRPLSDLRIYTMIAQRRKMAQEEAAVLARRGRHSLRRQSSRYSEASTSSLDSHRFSSVVMVSGCLCLVAGKAGKVHKSTEVIRSVVQVCLKQSLNATPHG